MGQVLVRNLSDEVISALKVKAELKGHSLEQELREIIEAAAPFTPAERLAISQQIRSMSTGGPYPPLDKEEMREGAM
jgi:plasmid stability protein